MVLPIAEEHGIASDGHAPQLRGIRSILPALAIGLAVISLLFFRELKAAVEVWDQSTAYSHCYLVLPMTVYLLWERRDVIAAKQAEPDLRFAWAALPLTIFWLVSERLGIMEGRQLAAVAGVELLCLTLLGRRVFQSLSGPLLYLFFLVPFGAFLTPALQQFTAAFSIVGLDLLGIPNFSDKFTIETPAGIFFVAEACAGLRFLIAAVAFGVFYSLLSYTSLTKRIVFIAASIVVPIFANGVRALGIVVLGQVLGSAEAAAADHLIYGWIFFSVVMLLLIAGGHAFRDHYQAPIGGKVVVPTVLERAPVWCIASVVTLLCLGPALAGVIDLTLVTPVLPDRTTIVASSECRSSNAEVVNSAHHRLFILICGVDRFEVNVEAFPARSTSSAMTSARRRVTQEVGAEDAAVSVLELSDVAGRWTVVQTIDPNRVTAYASWVDGTPVTSSVAGRVAQARDSIVGAAYMPVLITITSAEPGSDPPGRRKATLDRLTGLLREQSDLNSRMAALTRLGD